MLNVKKVLSLKEKYKKEIIPAMKEKFGYKNIMSCPKITKVVINTGIGRIAKEKELIENIRKDLSLITGQWPAIALAKKSISAFKVRKGAPAGLVVTLRGNKMYDFLDRLINTSLPRSRDFRGIDAKNIDRDGNLNIGIKEHVIFPEIFSESIKNVFSFEVTVVTSGKNRKQSESLFRLMGFPLKISNQ